MDVLRTLVVDISPVFGGIVVAFIICVTVARRIAVEQRSKRELQKQQYEINLQNSRMKALEHQRPINGD